VKRSQHPLRQPVPSMDTSRRIPSDRISGTSSFSQAQPAISGTKPLIEGRPILGQSLSPSVAKGSQINLLRKPSDVHVRSP
jgi:hypothetical protein